MNKEEWNSSQEEQRPLGKSTARDCNFAAITNRTFNISLVHHFNTALRVGTYRHAREQCIAGDRVCISSICDPNVLTRRGLL
jgi:hypothetical protein